jgi:hypothetical protein
MWQERVKRGECTVECLFEILENTESPIYGITAAKNLLIYGMDVSNAFPKAPLPKQGFYIYPDQVFHDWWVYHKKNPLLLLEWSYLSYWLCKDIQNHLDYGKSTPMQYYAM